jgi:hypothetical protein
MSDIFDFGFTAVDEDDLHSVEISKKIAEEQTATAEQLEARLDKLFNAITPLLNNLKKNPEKEYILWPDRLEKVEQFETMLQKIYKG